MKHGQGRTAVLLATVAGVALVAGAATAQTVKMGVPTFLTGAGAPAFGIPAKEGVELIIRGINNGELPAPYNSVGLAGRKIEPLIYDEAGGGTKQVTELRNKVQKDGVDLVVGYISSGTCAAVARVAEEVKVLTLMTVCGTPRVFRGVGEEAEIPVPHHEPRYGQQHGRGALYLHEAPGIAQGRLYRAQSELCVGSGFRGATSASR